LKSDISHLNPLSVIDQRYIIEKIGETIPRERMDRNQTLGGNGRGKSLEIPWARMA
jgi:hypothetical protein